MTILYVFSKLSLLTLAVEGKSLQTTKDRYRCDQTLIEDYKLAEEFMIFIMAVLSVPVIIFMYLMFSVFCEGRITRSR